MQANSDCHLPLYSSALTCFVLNRTLTCFSNKKLCFGYTNLGLHMKFQISKCNHLCRQRKMCESILLHQILQGQGQDQGRRGSAPPYIILLKFTLTFMKKWQLYPQVLMYSLVLKRGSIEKGLYGSKSHFHQEMVWILCP